MGRGDTAKLTLLIHPLRGSLILPLWLSGVVIAAALHFVPTYAGELDGQTLAALLLVPFALAAYYVRSSENSYVTRMLWGVRLTAAVPVLAGVLVITMLGLGYLDRQPGGRIPAGALDAACAAARAARGACTLLTIALIAPAVGGLVRPGLRKAQRAERVKRLQPRLQKREGLVGALVVVAALLALAAAVYALWKLPDLTWSLLRSI